MGEYRIRDVALWAKCKLMRSAVRVRLLGEQGPHVQKLNLHLEEQQQNKSTERLIRLKC